MKHFGSGSCSIRQKERSLFAGRKARTYSPELKLQAVQDYLAGEGSLMEISTKYGVRDKKNAPKLDKGV